MSVIVGACGAFISAMLMLQAFFVSPPICIARERLKPAPSRLNVLCMVGDVAQCMFVLAVVVFLFMFIVCCVY